MVITVIIILMYAGSRGAMLHKVNRGKFHGEGLRFQDTCSGFKA